MPLSAWLMLGFGSVVLYGLLAVCLGIAFRAAKRKEREAGAEE